MLVVVACIFLFVKPYYFSYFTTEYFILFAIGGISSWASLNIFNKNNILRSWVYSSISVFLIAVILFYPKTFDVAHIAIISLLFMLVAGGCDIFGLLRSASAILLGEISYSIYLLHGLILYVVLTYVPVINVESLDLMNYLLLMPAIAILVIISSCATYLLIEKPFVEIGKKYKLEKAIIFVTSNTKKAWQRIIH
jgi:peptidoglycan/LPS O-acetylase OafA/YrhL